MASDIETDDMGRSSRLSSVPLFKGEKLKFPDWARRFAAVCEQKHCADALEMDLISRLPVNPKIEATEEADRKKHNLAIKESDMAMALLNTALVGDAMGIFVTKTYTTMYTRGVACLVWKGLEEAISARWYQFDPRVPRGVEFCYNI
jgi:hypothetical protein